MHTRKLLRPLILFFACFSLTAHADQIEGQWKGILKCGPLLVSPPSPEFTMPFAMAVSGKEAITTRETEQYKEQTRGSVDGNGAVSLAGEGRLKNGSGTPWAMRLQGQFTGNRFMASGGIFGLDGTKRRECNADLTQISASTQTGAIGVTANPKTTDAPVEVKPAYPYSNSYEVVTSLADGRTGKIAYQTLNRSTSISDLQSGRIYKNDTAQAILSLPTKGKASYPVMVIAHSSAGVQPKDHDWVKWFNDLGVATLLIDTFTPRGIGNSASNQSVLSYGATIGEYLLALKLLETHPAIDIKRAGIIGFSRGGVAAMATSIESLRKGVIGGDLKYAVHFPVYGGCYFRAERWTGAPMHLLVGTEDSYENIDVCEGWKEHAKGKGIEADLTLFSGVHHGFDDSSKPGLRNFPNAEKWKPCKVEWNIDTHQFRTAGNPGWRPDNNMGADTATCTSKGVTVKYDVDATNQLKQKVESTLKRMGFLPDVSTTPAKNNSAST
jgi:dienelactone hydrolase